MHSSAQPEHRERSRTILVGNAPPRRDEADVVDSHERVVRINKCAGLGERRGSRISDLVLVNCGGQMKAWLNDPGFTEASFIDIAARVVLPIHPDKDRLLFGDTPPEERAGDAENHTEAASRRLRAAGKEVAVLDPGIFLSALEIIDVPVAPDMPAPSTGLLALIWLLDEDPDARIAMTGFTFEGWGGHAWERERRFVERLRECGRVTLL